jgi:hypothetical protein
MEPFLYKSISEIPVKDLITLKVGEHFRQYHWICIFQWISTGAKNDPSSQIAFSQTQLRKIRRRFRRKLLNNENYQLLYDTGRLHKEPSDFEEISIDRSDFEEISIDRSVMPLTPIVTFNWVINYMNFKRMNPGIRAYELLDELAMSRFSTANKICINATLLVPIVTMVFSMILLDCGVKCGKILRWCGNKFC